MSELETEYDEMFSQLGRRIRPNAIRKLTALLGNKEVISLAAGAPSSETFPVEELAEIASRVIRERGPVALQYGPTKGQPALVDAVVGILQERGLTGASAAEVIMTSGSQQGLDMISRVIIDPGECAVELQLHRRITRSTFASRNEWRAKDRRNSIRRFAREAGDP